jgi:hypothetical protein
MATTRQEKEVHVTRSRDRLRAVQADKRVQFSVFRPTLGKTWHPVSSLVVKNSGLQPGVREDILHQ